MQSIKEIAEAIDALSPREREVLMERIAQGTVKDSDKEKMHAIQDAMSDELFVADLREVMEDFSHVDGEENTA